MTLDFREAKLKNDPRPDRLKPTTMETQSEFIDSQLRRFFTVLFTIRARRHLQTLATHYGWSPEVLADYQTRFLPGVPLWDS